MFIFIDEAITEKDILKNADPEDLDNDGISGRAHKITDKPSKKITFFAEVRSKNYSSIKIFKSLNFVEDYSNKIHYFKKIYI